jgi:hypothetical protein
MSFDNRLLLQFARFVVVAVIVSSPQAASAAVSWQTVASGPNATATFEDPTNWAVPNYNPVPSIGPEVRPPGPDSTWFIEGATTRANFNGTITLNTPRDGSDANHPKIGAGSIGGGIANEVTRLVIAANVTVTGGERLASGDLSSTVRQMRIGQQDWTDDDVYPWGIVQQTHGTVNLEMAADPSRGDLLITNDKTISAGGIWEVGGDASFIIPTDMQMGSKVAVRAAGGIFRVRGSEVGSVTVGDRFQVHSQTATFDVTEVDLGGGLRHKFNRGKSVVEFVLDAEGVTPITIMDNLDLGSLGTVTTPTLGTLQAVMPAFLRVKLSEPTIKGMGTYNPDDPGGGDVIVLINSDRINSAVSVAPAGAEELMEGRFFDPDHTNDAGTSPHRALLDGFRIKSDYAGAQYSWQVNYFEDSGGTQNGVVTPAVILSDLEITGTQGDLNGDAVLNEMDRAALLGAIASPPATHYDLLGAAQHRFDLNADDIINNLDLVTFNTHFLPPAGLAGDYNNNGAVDAADYVLWRNNPGSLQNEGASPGAVDQADYEFWRAQFGKSSSAGASLAAGAVPEPHAIGLAIVAMIALLTLRRGNLPA